MRRITVWGVTLGATLSWVAAYQWGLHAAVSPTSLPHPTLLLLCIGTDREKQGETVYFPRCASDPWVLKTSDDCAHALDSVTWALRALEGLQGASADTISLLCTPPEGIAAHGPTRPPHGKAITG